MDSLPKFKLDLFDGDPVRCSDWMSMFQSIIDDVDISCNAKMQHLQNTVVGRAKETIEGHGYSGELYAEALEKLESRFGKSHIVVKAHLNRLWKWSKLSDDRLYEVRRFSDVISTAVKTFKRLGYINDLHAANNLNTLLKHHCVPKFKELSVQERLAKVKEHGLCFRCFERRWASKCRCSKQCGINGYIGLRNELLHRTMEEDKSPSMPTPEEPPI